jgi:hypothetical protein
MKMQLRGATLSHTIAILYLWCAAIDNVAEAFAAARPPGTTPPSNTLSDRGDDLINIQLD